jgi:hypothetical protein
MLGIDSHRLATTFVAVTGLTVSGNQNVNFTAQLSFSAASAHLFAGSALKTVRDR